MWSTVLMWERDSFSLTTENVIVNYLEKWIMLRTKYVLKKEIFFYSGSVGL